MRVSWKLFRDRSTPDITQKLQKKRRNQKRKVGNSLNDMGMRYIKYSNMFANSKHILYEVLDH